MNEGDEKGVVLSRSGIMVGGPDQNSFVPFWSCSPPKPEKKKKVGIVQSRVTV